MRGSRFALSQGSGELAGVSSDRTRPHETKKSDHTNAVATVRDIRNDSEGFLWGERKGSIVAHLLVVCDRLSVLGLWDLSTALIDDGQGRIAEGVVGLELDDLLRVRDGLVG